MVNNRDRAAGCVMGYNTVIKAVKYVDRYDRIDPTASWHIRRVLKVIYGEKLYNYYCYRGRRPTLRLVSK